MVGKILLRAFILENFVFSENVFLKLFKTLSRVRLFLRTLNPRKHQGSY